MNRALFTVFISTIFGLSYFSRPVAAFSNPYTLADLIDVASIFIKDPLDVGGLTCEEAIS